MRALASFQDLYVGLEPYKNEKQLFGGVIKKTAPAVFGLLAALELHPTNNKAGVFAPIGGFRSVGNAFQSLAKDCGVQFQYNKTVTKITKNGVYTIDSSISSTGEKDVEFLPADVIVVNADFPFATRTLLDPKEGDEKNKDNGSSSGSAATTSTTIPIDRYDWDDKFDYSSGVVAFHWSLNKELTGLNTHNVFLCANSREEAEQSWSVLRNDNDGDNNKYGKKKPFNFYVHRASETDPTAAPEGCDAIMILVPCKTLLRNKDLAKLPRKEAIEKYKDQFDDDFISNMRNEVLERLAVVVDKNDDNDDVMKNLRQHILHEVIDTPASYADFYNVGAGVPFGLSHGFGQLSLTRPSAQSKDIENVLFVGA
eukprot:12428967-Ditylum_brightwellii.AAC.1